jgi:prolyl-tRNA synthetase
MKRTQLFSKTRKDHPADETAKNAQLLLQAGFVHKEMAGVYAYLPLGLRVIENIKQIVREEMQAIDSNELIMTNLQRPELWQKTDRWDDSKVDVWFKTRLQDDSELGLAWSHEEPIMNMMQSHVASYKDLPASVFQFQTKLRNELRAKSGIMRGREFVMKDMYSLHATQEDCDTYYDKAIIAYNKIFERLGIGSETFVTFASGGAFTKFSHEFQTLCEAGEDTLYVNEDRSVAVNEEVLDDATNELGVDKANLKPAVTAEVGNIFKFGSAKSEQMDINYTDKDGSTKPIYLASYGIGITRVMGVIAEKLSDSKGLVWPENIAPYRVYLAPLDASGPVAEAAEALYGKLKDSGISVLYDDRDVRPGQKFADADLMGIPHRVVISKKTLDKSQVEYKNRKSDDTDLISEDQLLDKLA